jgi:hypothetical protein
VVASTRLASEVSCACAARLAATKERAKMEIVIGLAVLFFIIWAWSQILAKMGYSAASALLFLIPIGNLFYLFYLATAQWPIENEVARLKEHDSNPRDDHLTLMFRRAEHYERMGEWEEAYKQFTMLTEALRGLPGEHLAAHHAAKVKARMGLQS